MKKNRKKNLNSKADLKDASPFSIFQNGYLGFDVIINFCDLFPSKTDIIPSYVTDLFRIHIQHPTTIAKGWEVNWVLNTGLLSLKKSSHFAKYIYFVVYFFISACASSWSFPYTIFNVFFPFKQHGNEYYFIDKANKTS